MHSTVPPSATGTAQAKPCGCQSVGQPCQCQSETTTQTCCELVCFERPRYFCGHLLRDEDLMREQRYFREKNKLYHRTLHGHGVVCGLRLTCHPRCNGQILIGDGYAIDDCGNDLVVCDPLAFDVLGELRRLGWLDNPPPPDPCQKEEEKGETDDCKIRTCYYVTLCYDEQESDFTTPFVTSCGTGPQTCEATRVREGVRVELRTTLPTVAKPREEWCQRIKDCLAFFTEGEFHNALVQNGELVYAAFSNNAVFSNPQHDPYQDVFLRLRAHFLLYLNRHPEQYSCTLQKRLEKLPFVVSEKTYPEDVRKAFCDLFDLVEEHISNCVLNEMIFACNEPCAAACIVLGTVQIENGELIRVSNYPRDYVWSFASLRQVFPIWLNQEILTRTHQRLDQQTDKLGCDGLRVSTCGQLAKDLMGNPKALVNKFCTSANAIALLRKATQRSFDFTREKAFNPQQYQGQTVSKAMEVAKAAGLQPKIVDVAGELPEPDFLEALGLMGLKTPTQALTFLQRDNVVVAVQPEAFPAAKLDETERKQWEEKFTKTNQQLELSNKQISDLRELLDKKEKLFTDLSNRLLKIEKKVDIPLPNMQPPKGGKKGGGK